MEDRGESGGIVSILTGRSTLIVGVEDDPEPGLLRVYIGARYNGTYVLVSDPEDQARIRRAWGDTSAHIFMPTPPRDAIYVEERADANP